jgi:phage/plasmid-like protein (TIGR03299 family)
MPNTELDVKRLPWAENMVEISAGATSQELLEAAGLDWTVEKTTLLRRPPYIPVTSQEDGYEPITVMAPNLDGQLFEAEDVFDIQRPLDGKIFGQVGGDYVPVQNIEAFTFADHLVFDEGGEWIAAGEQYGGKIVFGVMKLNGHTIMIDDRDPVDLYLTIRTSHNGTTGLQAYVTPVRMTCENMTSFMIAEAKHKWSMRHVGDVAGKIQQARDTLRLSLKYQDELERELNELLQVPVSDEKAEWVLGRVIKGSEKRKERVITGILSCYLDDETNGFAGTGYGLLNGLTDYFDHEAKRQSSIVRLQEQYDGEGARARNSLVAELLHK